MKILQRTFALLHFCTSESLTSCFFLEKRRLTFQKCKSPLESFHMVSTSVFLALKFVLKDCKKLQICGFAASETLKNCILRPILGEILFSGLHICLKNANAGKSVWYLGECASLHFLWKWRQIGGAGRRKDVGSDYAKYGSYLPDRLRGVES